MPGRAKPAAEGIRSRPPLERMVRIHQAVQSGTYPNASTLAFELEVCTKSVHRDLGFMRDRLNLPLEFDSHHQGYYYTEEVNAFPTLQLTEGELVALVMAEKALQQYRGTSLEKPLLSAIQKMEQSLPETVSVDVADVARTISFRTRAEPMMNLENFETLAKATAGQQQLELAYRKPGQNEPEQRRVDPLHIANINGEWFLFAFDHLRKDIRTFALARIKSIHNTGKRFERPQKFSLEQRLRGSFGVRSGSDNFDIVIRFTQKVADYVREKKWHESQQLRELKGGEVELRMKLSSLPEVERWILSWGGEARVIRPPELAEAVRRAARKILQR